MHAGIPTEGDLGIVMHRWAGYTADLPSFAVVVPGVSHQVFAHLNVRRGEQ